MEVVVKVPDITCEHCKATVEQALLGVEGVRSADVDVPAKSVVVEHEDVLDDAALIKAVEDAGYSVSELAR